MRLEMLKKKNKILKANGFHLYALEFQIKLKKNNHGIDDIEKVKLMAAPHWSKLTSLERSAYKLKAMYNCEGDNDHMAAKRKMRIKKAENGIRTADIKRLVFQKCEAGELDDMVFFLISATTFFSDDINIYPAELAIAKFSLNGRIIDDIQICINPGRLPANVAAAAQEKSRKTHKYSFPPYNEGEREYITVLETIVKFLHPLSAFPCLFAEGRNQDNATPLDDTFRIMSKILHESGEDDLKNNLIVCPVDELFYAMQTAITSKKRRNGVNAVPFPSPSFASNLLQLEVSKFYSPGCEFHNSIKANKHCCLSKVRAVCHVTSHWCGNGDPFGSDESEHHSESS